jgi:hypothetical protein
MNPDQENQSVDKKQRYRNVPASILCASAIWLCYGIVFAIYSAAIVECRFNSSRREELNIMVFVINSLSTAILLAIGYQAFLGRLKQVRFAAYFSLALGSIFMFVAIFDTKKLDLQILISCIACPLFIAAAFARFGEKSLVEYQMQTPKQVHRKIEHKNQNRANYDDGPDA